MNKGPEGPLLDLSLISFISPGREFQTFEAMLLRDLQSEWSIKKLLLAQGRILIVRGPRHILMGGAPYHTLSWKMRYVGTYY